MTQKGKSCLILIFIFLLAIFLRFYRIGERYSVFGDMGRDVLVAREAVKLGFSSWPAVGSFASAGPFVFGPLFYWLISLSYLPNTNWIILPWLTTAFVSFLFVVVMYESGRQLGGKRLGWFTALLAAVSPAQVIRSELLTQHSFIGISSAVVLLTFILYLKKRRSKVLFLMGLTVGFALSMHYQAINLLFFPTAALVFRLLKKAKLFGFLKDFLALGMGLLLPSLPLILWDSRQNWANIRNILDYFLIGQYRIYVPNRWLTYIGQFWPEFWGSVAGGLPILGGLLMMLAAVFALKDFVGNKLPQTLFRLGLIFLFQFLLLRYHRGERFEGYLIYFHPLIILFSAWSLKRLTKKILPAAVILTVLLFFSLKFNFSHILRQETESLALLAVVNDLKKHFPGQKFSLHDHHLQTMPYSFGISLFLDRENLIDKNTGINLGACALTCPAELPVVGQGYANIKIIDLSLLDKKRLVKPEWTPVNPRDVYEDVALWWQKEPLKSPFSLQKFILEKLGVKP